MCPYGPASLALLPHVCDEVRWAEVRLQRKKPHKQQEQFLPSLRILRKQRAVTVRKLSGPAALSMNNFLKEETLWRPCTIFDLGARTQYKGLSLIQRKQDNCFPNRLTGEYIPPALVTHAPAALGLPQTIILFC